MKRQYMIIPIGDRMATANVFASEVEDDGKLWSLYVGELANREFVGHVWKDRATLELCQHEYADAAAEAHYPVICSAYMVCWPIRAGFAEPAGSVGR